MENKEIELVKEQSAKCLSAVSGIVVTNQDEYDRATLVGKKVSALLKTIDEKEKLITKPINDSLKKIRDMFRPYKEQVENAKNDIKSKMETYIKAENERKAIEEARVMARIEKGTIKEETAVRKLGEIEDTKTVTSGTTTSVLTVELIDIKQVPAEYLLIDESKIKEDFRAGKEIAGVKCFYQTKIRL
jgi:signal transduction protein with GAF and PtsI domain